MLAGHRKACLIGGFDAEEHRFKAGLRHHPHHLVVGGEVHRGLSGEGEGIAPLDLPFLDRRQQQFGVAFVADEVVVHQEDGAAPAQVVEPLQLGHQLFRTLGAGLTPVQHDDVAELALERAAPRELHAHRVVGVEFEQVKAGDRGARYIRFFAVGAEAARAVAPLDRLDEQGQGDFPLIEHLEIGQGNFGGVGGGTGEGAAHSHRQAPPLGLGDLRGHVGLLDDHPGDHHQLGPTPLRFGDLAHIAVDQLHLPGLGQQGRHGDQTEGGQQNLAVHQFEDLLVAPEGLRELGIDEEGAHGCGRPGVAATLDGFRTTRPCE